MLAEQVDQSIVVAIIGLLGALLSVDIPYVLLLSPVTHKIRVLELNIPEDWKLLHLQLDTSNNSDTCNNSSKKRQE